MSRPVGYDAVLKRRFGYVSDITPDAARSKADELETRAEQMPTRSTADKMLEDAAALRDYAADADTDPIIETDDKPDSAAKPQSGSSKSSKRKPAKKRKRTRTEKAASDALTGEPDRMIAGTVTSASGMFWRIVGITLIVVIVYRLIQPGGNARAVKLIGSIGTAVERVIYPKGAFPQGPPRRQQRRKAG